jgi:hypothetical protein
MSRGFSLRPDPAPGNPDGAAVEGAAAGNNDGAARKGRPETIHEIGMVDAAWRDRERAIIF